MFYNWTIFQLVLLLLVGVIVLVNNSTTVVQQQYNNNQHDQPTITVQQHTTTVQNQTTQKLKQTATEKQQTDPQVNINVPEREANLRLNLIKKESPDVFENLPDHFLEDYSSFCWYDTSSRFRCLPRVYLAGMPKCGSTDLFWKLMSHPDIYHPNTIGEKPLKENHYWARTRIGKSRDFRTHSKIKKVPFKDYVDLMGGEKLEGKREKVRVLYSEGQF